MPPLKLDKKEKKEYNRRNKTLKWDNYVGKISYRYLRLSNECPRI